MRFTKDELHPVIFERMKDFAQSAYAAQGQTPEQQKIYFKHSGIWFKEYWKGLTIWLAGLPAMIALTSAAKESASKPVAAMTFITLLAIWVVAGVIGYSKSQGQASIEELEILRPGLKLSEIEGLYLDCFLAVQRCELLDIEQKKSWCAALKDAMERSLELERLEGELREMSGGKDAHEIDAEINRLQGLIDATEDAIAKQTYRESLEMVRSRSTKADGALVQIERTEAHLELTRQTFIRTKEMVKSLQISQRQPTPVDLDPLRANLERVQSDAKLIVNAIEELNQV
jgi:hypothetical protein